MKTPSLCFVIALVAAPTGKADLTGRWTLRQDRDFRGDSGRPVECTFKQDGDEFTVTCGSTGAVMKGRVNGQKVTWGIEKTGIPPNRQDRLVLTYSGELSQSGSALNGTWRLTSGVVDEKGTFRANRNR